MFNIDHVINLKILIISFIVGYLISFSLKINKHPIYNTVIILILYFFLLFLQNKNNISINDQKILNNDVLDYNILPFNKNIKGENFSNQFSNLSKKKGNSPFDGLEPQELTNKLNYLHYATSHPFKPKSYLNYKKNIKKYSENSLEAPNSVKHLNATKEHYPSLGYQQINYTDCMNHPVGDKLSCRQKSILVSGINNTKDLNQVVREDFSAPHFINEKLNDFKVLFNTSPYNITPEKPRDYSYDLCSGCVVSEEQPFLSETDFKNLLDMKLASEKEAYIKQIEELFE